MSDVQAIVYKRLLCSICIEEGSYMDQHREIRDDGAESELISACLTPSFPHLHTNIVTQKPSVKEVLGHTIWPEPQAPGGINKKGRSPFSPPFSGSGYRSQSATSAEPSSSSARNHQPEDGRNRSRWRENLHPSWRSCIQPLACHQPNLPPFGRGCCEPPA